MNEIEVVALKVLPFLNGSGKKYMALFDSSVFFSEYGWLVAKANSKTDEASLSLWASHFGPLILGILFNSFICNQGYSGDIPLDLVNNIYLRLHNISFSLTLYHCVRSIIVFTLYIFVN
jgi:hypothetical protein